MANEVVKIKEVTKTEKDGIFIYNFPEAVIQANVSDNSYSVLWLDKRRDDLITNFDDITDKLGASNIEEYVDELANQGLFFLTKFVKITGDTMTGNLIMDDGSLIQVNNVSGDKIGVVGAGATFGMIITALDTDGNFQPVLLTGSTTVIGGETIGMTINGGEEGTFLRLGTSFDVAGTTVFTLEAVPLDVDEHSQTDTDNTDTILDGTFKSIINIVSDYNYRANSSYADFQFTVEEQANQSTKVEYFIAINQVDPGASDHFQATIPKGVGNTVITISGTDISQNAVDIADEVDIFIKAVDTGSGRITTVKGTVVPTRLRLVQTSNVSNQTQRIINISGLQSLDEPFYNRITAPGTYTLCDALTVFNENKAFIIAVHNASGSDKNIDAEGSDTISTKNGVLSSIIIRNGETIFFIASSPTTWDVMTDHAKPQIEYAEDEGTTATTSLTYQQKVTLNFDAIAGDYIVSWTCELVSNNLNTSVLHKLELDNVTIINEADPYTDTPTQTGRGVSSGFKKVTLTAGSHTFDLDFSSTKSGKTVEIRRARISVNKI